MEAILFDGGEKNMMLCGFSRTYSTVNGEQYVTIGKFWDDMSARYGRENLRGLGFHWTQNTIEYLIGTKNNDIDKEAAIKDAIYKEVLLPDEGWMDYDSRTDSLPELYGRVYREGSPDYEIEMFDDNGRCKVRIHR
jgi:hypothetical protein